MSKRFLDALLGPYPMNDPPVRIGFYAVELRGSDGRFEMWYWDGTSWSDSDDGLGDAQNPDHGAGWWGKFPPPDEAASDGLDL